MLSHFPYIHRRGLLPIIIDSSPPFFLLSKHVYNEICAPLTLLMNRKHTLIHLTNRITQLIDVLRKMAGQNNCLPLFFQRQQ